MHLTVETRRRIAKTMTYRVICTAILFGVSWLFTGSVMESGFITVTAQALQTVAYYWHERYWDGGGPHILNKWLRQ